MNKRTTLEAITAMAADDNKGVSMTATIMNAKTENGISSVEFRVDESVINGASLQALNIPGQYICVAFFIDREELKKYK